MAMRQKAVSDRSHPSEKSYPANLKNRASSQQKKYRISGHETFPCRYAWLPKAARHLSARPDLFSNDEQAMVDLGVGKNMVHAIRFWTQAAGVAEPGTSGKYSLTPFGSAVLGANGHDPFLEDVRTLWLIHWNLASDIKNPLLAWDYLLNRWQEPELVASPALKALQREATKANEGPSLVTIEQHFDAFLHTYVPTRGRKGEVQEDNLDCPLVELEFIIRIGERDVDRSAGRRETIYAFRREEKPEITPEVFVYCLCAFWKNYHDGESTLPLREVAHGHGSPGQIFKLPEDDVRIRLEGLARQTGRFLTYSESANLEQIHKEGDRTAAALLQDVYAMEPANV